MRSSASASTSAGDPALHLNGSVATEFPMGRVPPNVRSGGSYLLVLTPLLPGLQPLQYSSVVGRLSPLSH